MALETLVACADVGMAVFRCLIVVGVVFLLAWFMWLCSPSSRRKP